MIGHEWYQYIVFPRIDIVHRSRDEFSQLGSDALAQRWRDIRFFVGVDEKLGGLYCRSLPGCTHDCASGAQDHLPVDWLTSIN